MCPVIGSGVAHKDCPLCPLSIANGDNTGGQWNGKKPQERNRGRPQQWRAGPGDGEQQRTAAAEIGAGDSALVGRRCIGQ